MPSHVARHLLGNPNPNPSPDPNPDPNPHPNQVAGRPIDTALFATVCESCGQDFVPLVTGGSGELRLQAQGPTEVLSMSLQERLPLLAYPYP